MGDFGGIVAVGPYVCPAVQDQDWGERRHKGCNAWKRPQPQAGANNSR
jgi:hypothetical protein